MINKFIMFSPNLINLFTVISSEFVVNYNVKYGGITFIVYADVPV